MRPWLNRVSTHQSSPKTRLLVLEEHNIGDTIINIGFWGLCYTYNKEPPKVLVIIEAPILRLIDLTSWKFTKKVSDRALEHSPKTLKPERSERAWGRYQSRFCLRRASDGPGS